MNPPLTKKYAAVKALIEKYPELVDNDSRLCANFWRGELKAMNFNLEERSAIELLGLIRDDELTSYDVITRNRRLVEELNPPLRGATWAKRQKHKQDDVKGDIKNLKENYEKKDPTQD